VCEVKAGAIQGRIDNHNGRRLESIEAWHHSRQLYQLATAKRSEDSSEESEK
jgi:hypothetical protein